MKKASLIVRYIVLILMLLVGLTNVEAQHTHATNQHSDSIAMQYDIEDIVVTAQYAPTDSKNALQSIQIIDRTRIEQLGANNLEQLLQQNLNIRVTQDLVLGSGLSLLGVGGENIKIMIDGVPMVGRLDGNLDLSQINLNNIERIEIIEGPMSVTYGTDALGGVINLITKKSQRFPLEFTFNQQLETRAENSTSVDGGIRLKDNLLLRFNGGKDWFNGYSPDTTRSVLWNPKDQWYADLSLRYDLENDHRLIYQFSHFDEEVQNLGAIRRPQFKPYAFDDYFLTQRTNHAISHEGQVLKDFYWQNTIGYNAFDREVNSYRLDFEEDAQNLMGGDTTSFDTYMFRSVLASNFRNRKINFQLGIDLRYEQGQGARIADESSNRLGQSSIGDYAIFGSLRYQPTKTLTLESGLRATQNSRYDAPLIPSLHLKYDLFDDLSLRASYGKGFRSPSLKELFLSFIDINHFIIGNPDLEAETADNFQVNLAFRRSNDRQKISAQLQLFHNQINNQIQLFPFIEEDGQLIASPNGVSTEFAYFNLDRNITKGANLRLAYQWKAFEVEGGISQIGLFNPLSDESVEVARFSYLTELNGRISYRLPFSQTKVNLFGRFNDQFITYYPEMVDGESIARQSVQDGFTMLDLSLSQALFNNRVQLTGGIRNILDISQVNIIGGNPAIHANGNTVPVGAGRSFFVKASIRLFDDKAAKFRNSPFEQQQKQGLRLQNIDQQFYASWIEDQNEGEQVFQFAAKKANNWERPKTIKIGNKNWFINDIDAPQFTPFKDNDKAMVALWLEKSNPRNVYDHHIWLSHSRNNGKSWSTPYQPYDTEVPAFYGLAKFIPLSKEKMLLIWLDGRDTKEAFKDTGRFVPKKDGTLSIRSVEINTKGKLTNEQELALNINQLCPFDAIETDDGAMMIYRDERNDIVLKKYIGQTWKLINAFPNQIDKFLTVSSPVIDQHNDQLALAWFIQHEGNNVIKVTSSLDQGVSFSEPVSLATSGSKGKIDMVVMTNKQLAIGWEEPEQFMLNILDPSGKVIQERSIPFKADTLASAPVLHLRENGQLVVYLNDQAFEINIPE